MEIKMVDNLFLVTVQPGSVERNPLKQWENFQILIGNFLDSQSRNNNSVTLISLPEYAFGNILVSENTTFAYKKLYQSIAKFTQNNNINLVAGSVAVQEQGKWLNRAYFWNSSGQLIGTYDKQRLFNYEKKLKMTSGSSSNLFWIENERLAVQILICSDFWYPELIRKNLSNLPDVIVVPASSVVPQENLTNYGRTLWHSLALTRARESAVPVLVSDWAAQEMKTSWTSGGSSIVDPSMRWTNDREFQESNQRFENGEQGILGMNVSRKSIHIYRKYRREVGLLPELI